MTVSWHYCHIVFISHTVHIEIGYDNTVGAFILQVYEPANLDDYQEKEGEQ